MYKFTAPYVNHMHHRVRRICNEVVQCAAAQRAPHSGARRISPAAQQQQHHHRRAQLLHPRNTPRSVLAASLSPSHPQNNYYLSPGIQRDTLQDKSYIPESQRHAATRPGRDNCGQQRNPVKSRSKADVDDAAENRTAGCSWGDHTGREQ